jgi:hypothetical protein
MDYYNTGGGVKKRRQFMRHERFVPMEYANQELMDDLNNYCIALKIWLHPELFGDKLQNLHRRYGKPEIQDIDEMMARLMQALREDSKPMIRY